MIGDSGKGRKAAFTAIRQIKILPGITSRFKRLIVISLVLAVVCATGFAMLNTPLAAWIGNYAIQDKTLDIEATINNRPCICRIYYKNPGHIDEEGQLYPTVIICGLQTEKNKEAEPLKLWTDWIGCFQYPKDYFQVRDHYVLLRGGSRVTVDLSDDIKGWDVEYYISDNGDRIDYEIKPSSNHPFHIRFSIPKTFFFGDNAPKKLLSTVHKLPYRLEKNVIE